MVKEENTQFYRAGVGALILNDAQEILMVQNNSYRKDEWDFVKGGMKSNEDEQDTLEREIGEELGNEFKFEIIKRSIWNVVYEWPKEKQIERGMRGQARVSYWLMHKGGDINLNTDELRAVKWVKLDELEDFLKKSLWEEDHIFILMYDLKMIRKEVYGDD